MSAADRCACDADVWRAALDVPDATLRGYRHVLSDDELARSDASGSLAIGGASSWPTGSFGHS